MTLEGRVAIVTGAGQGVGRGIAIALAAKRAAVVVAARRAETGAPVAREIEASGGSAVCVETDVTKRDDVARAVTTAVEAFGGLDVMVHNAFGASGQGHHLETVELDEWRLMSATAVWGSFHCAQLAFPQLRAGRGRLILVTSGAGIEGSAFMPLYAAVKGAQRALAKSLALEWGPAGITVNCIAPVADTPALGAAFAGNPEMRDRVVAASALGRIGDPVRDVGGVVAFLASDAAGYITGQTIRCDGGRVSAL